MLDHININNSDNNEINVNKNADVNEQVEAIAVSQNEANRLENKSRVDLIGNQHYEFQGYFDKNYFEDNDTRSKSTIKGDYEASKTKLERYKSDKDAVAKFSEVRKAEMTNFKDLSSKLVKDKWGWCNDSPEMDRVKKMVNLLNNLLDQEYATFDGNVNVMEGKVKTAFEEVIKACNNYITLKKEKKQGKHSGGIRRLKMVNDIMTRCQLEMHHFNFLSDALKTESIVEPEIGKRMNDYKLKELTTRHVEVEATDAEFQNEGNSTDVYKITVKGDDGKTYYIKENLPLIDEDVDGFLDRRISQLEKSKEFKNSENMEVKRQEENRLSKANIDNTDYDLSIKLFKALKKKIDKSAEVDKRDVRKKVADFFRHDFDKLFEDLTLNNQAAEKVNENNGEINWQEIINSNDKDNPLWAVAKYMVNRQQNDGGVVAPIKKMTAFEWIKEKLSLDESDDKDILSVFKSYEPKFTKKTNEADKKRLTETFDKRVETFFRVSSGKEVELFGQVSERNGAEGEIAAANNTATCELAKLMNFTDVVTTSDNRIVKFKDRTGKTASRYCTVCETAEGVEYIDVLKKAYNENKTVHYTPSVIKQLMRLQAFDTISMQTDRHGRNFKCVVEEKGDNLVITKIKAYDHDMSFSEKGIEDIKGEKLGFLQPLNMQIKRGSSMYTYINKHYFKDQNDLDWLRNAIKPFVSVTLGGVAVDRKLGEQMRENILFYFLRDNYKQYEIKDKYGEKRFSFRKDFDIADHNYEVLNGSESIRGHIYIRDPEFNNIKLDDKKVKFDDREDLKLTEAKEQEIWSKVRNSLISIKDLCVTLDVYEGDEEKKQKVEGAPKPEQSKAKKKKSNNANKQRVKVNFKLKDVNEMSRDDKVKLYKEIQKLAELNQKYDLRYVKTLDGDYSVAGLVEFSIENLIFLYTNMMKSDPDFEEIFIQDKKEMFEAFKTIRDDNGNYNLPTILHYDKAAYDVIKDVAEGKKPITADIKKKLKELNFTDKKNDAVINRCKELKAYIDDAKKKAEAFYKLAGWDSKTVKGTFFLEDKDYEKFDDLSELSIDPGATYLSIDNSSYLFGQSEYFNLASQKEKDDMQKIKRDQMNDPKRWNFPEFKKFNFQVNPLTGKIMNNKAG